MNPYNTEHLKIVKALQTSQFDINTIFVTPANIDPFELEDMLTHLSQITIDTLCYTKVDLCQRVAAMLHAITHFDIPNHLFSSTDSVDKELKTLDAKEILALLLSQKTQSSPLQKVSQAMTNIATKFKSQSNASKESVPPAVTVIASGKGGVGKTWCSITLATLAAKAGKKILLFDGDIGLTNVDIQLDSVD